MHGCEQTVTLRTKLAHITMVQVRVGRFECEIFEQFVAKWGRAFDVVVRIRFLRLGHSGMSEDDMFGRAI